MTTKKIEWYSITIAWKTHIKDIEIKTYTFKNAEEMEAFKYGVCESNDWLNYKIIDEEIEVA